MPTPITSSIRCLLPALLLAALPRPAQAVELTVGDEPACDHSSVQAAIDAATGPGRICSA